MIITALVGDHRCESAVLITFLAEVDQNCTFSMATFEKKHRAAIAPEQFTLMKKLPRDSQLELIMLGWVRRCLALVLFSTIISWVRVGWVCVYRTLLSKAFAWILGVSNTR